MSFILDALKKSDKKRQVVVAPSLDTVHKSPAAAKGHSKRRLWIFLALLILLLSGGLLFWLLNPGQEMTLAEPLTKQKIIARPAESIARELAPSVKSVAKPAPIQKEVTTPAEPPPSIVEEQVTEIPVASSQGSPGRVYAIAELPGSIRGQLPEMHMSLHAFSQDDAAASLVRINDRMMREGAKLANRYLLEEITAEGAIFSYQGYRFLLPR